jgi:CBASS immunity sensor of nucleotide second messenger signals
MMNKILATIVGVARQYWKYKFRDVGMTFSTLLISSGMAIILSGALWQLILDLDWLNIPAALSLNSNNVLGFGILLVIIGTGIGILRLRDLGNIISGILIIHNGMEGMNTNSIQNELPKSFIKGRLEIINLYQSHQLHEGIVLSPERALNVINNLDQQIETRLSGRSINDVKLAYGGLAPIPLLVAAGYKISSRQECLILDYSRGNGWHGLDDLDDGENVSIQSPSKEVFNEVAIIMPFSVDISENQLPEQLIGKVYRFNLENGARPDSLNSTDKQKRITKEFYSFCANLRAKHPNVERIHLFLASQASFSFRLGTVVSASVLPPIIFYQYDVQKNKYGWRMIIKPGVPPAIMDS